MADQPNNSLLETASPAPPAALSASQAVPPRWPFSDGTRYGVKRSSAPTAWMPKRAAVARSG
eukprot:scaffold4194_cov131-Isochrysis_galbana.AAC.9